MKFFIALTLCALSAFQGSQGRRINPVTDGVLEVFKALKNGNFQSVENSLSSVSVDSEDDRGYTLLMRAAENGNEAMVKMLLKHGANVNKSDWLNKFTPLQLANKDRGCGWVSWDCDARGKANYDRISELLIKNGADVNSVNAHGITLLHDVAQSGYENVAELIFKNGGSKTVNQKSGSDTPLCYVAYNGGYPEGHDRIAELIIQNGADVNLRCNKDRTPLHLAAIKARLGIVKLLVENGAEVSPKDEDGKTPLDLAKSRGSDNKPIIEYLEQHEKH